MNPEYFESSTSSLVLSWMFSVPALAALLTYGVGFLIEKQEDVSWLYTSWFGLCILVLSPFRYMMWQIIAATCFMFSSISAFLSCFLLAIYVPIVFGLLYGIGIGIPLLLGVWIAGGFKEEISKLRLWCSALLLPFILTLGTHLFFLALPLGARTIHWLGPDDVIRASNGPSYVAYEFVARWGMPIELPKYAAIGTKSDKELLRAHIALIYLGELEHIRYIQLAYPELYQSMQSKRRDQQSVH